MKSPSNFFFFFSYRSVARLSSLGILIVSLIYFVGMDFCLKVGCIHLIQGQCMQTTCWATLYRVTMVVREKVVLGLVQLSAMTAQNMAV